MKSFLQYLNEAKGTKEDFAIKADLQGVLGNRIKPNNKGRWHLRGNVGEDPESFFKRYGYTLKNTTISLSGQYTTYRIEKEGLGSTLFVNTIRVNSSINTKDLTPEKIGLVGKDLKRGKIVSISSDYIESSIYSRNIKDLLLELIQKSQGKGDDFQIESYEVKPAEIRTIANDFGEVLCALWSFVNIGFKRVHFPIASNEPLLDFYGIRGKIRYPISVKSGGGSATSLKNIVNLIFSQKDMVDYEYKFTENQKNLIELMIKISEMNSIEGFIEAHKILNTDAIKKLSKATNISISDLNKTNINQWMQGKTSQDLQKELKSFYKSMGNYVDEKTWSKYDRGDLNKPIGVITGPMGHNIVKILNSKDNIETLSLIAQKVTLLQMNIDINSKRMMFKRGKFKEFSFKFSWQGGAPNPDRNKLGFKAILK